MTINEIISYCIAPSMLTVEIYDTDREEIIWSGNGEEIPDEYLYKEIWSWDVPTELGKITININTFFD